MIIQKSQPKAGPPQAEKINPSTPSVLLRTSSLRTRMTIQNSKIIIQKIDEITQPQEYIVRQNEHLTLILTAVASANYQTQVKLTGEGAEADILGIILGSDAHEIRINTFQDHQAPNTKSNLLIKSALSGRSQLFYEGFIRVEKQAQRTDAYQRNENLLLSKETKAESKPALEILANDVRCTHSATISKIDPEQLFYLESRGLKKNKASSLILVGYFQSILDKISNNTQKNRLIDKISGLTSSS